MPRLLRNIQRWIHILRNMIKCIGWKYIDAFLWFLCRDENVDSTLYKDESTFLRKATKCLGQNNEKTSTYLKLTDWQNKQICQINNTNSQTVVLVRNGRIRNVPLPVQCCVTSKSLSVFLHCRQQLEKVQARPLYVSTSPYRLYFCQDTNSLGYGNGDFKIPQILLRPDLLGVFLL